MESRIVSSVKRAANAGGFNDDLQGEFAGATKKRLAYRRGSKSAPWNASMPDVYEVQSEVVLSGIATFVVLTGVLRVSARD